MSAATKPQGRRLVLRDVDWQTYSRLLRAFSGRRAVRLTYDRGVLEIMSPSLFHDNVGRVLARMVIVLTEELGLPIMSGGSTTLRRRLKKRGLEPDECFWIASEPEMRGKTRVNLAQDPPPDLALEVDATRSSLNRMAIYAALRVPEVWRWQNDVLEFYGRAGVRPYHAIDRSFAFPVIRPVDLLPHLQQRLHTEENALIAAFRQWVRMQRNTSRNVDTP